VRLRRDVLLAAASVALAAASLIPAQSVAHTYSFGVVNFYNPRLMYLKYQPLVDYLSEQTGLHWELVLSSSYEHTVRELCAGQLDVAYLGPYTYARAHELCGARPVVQLKTGGKLTYRGLIMVRSSSPARVLADIRGQRIGFGAPLSTSSHLVAREMLERAGLNAGRDVTCVYFMHHDRAARAVLLGEVEACAVRDIVGEKFVQRGLRVLAASDPIPNFPFVLTPARDEELRDRMARVLVSIPSASPHVRGMIGSWDEELAGGFAVCNDGDFDGLRALARRVFGPRAMSIPEADIECGGEGH
jgi:phosphonate transport system substrate-binding protein